ncbi:MAG TPA: hypothetical protein VIA45_15550 [Thermoanaerobaculia bacterium]
MCLVILLTGAAAAPHRHKNDLADLLTEAPSDSGVFLDVVPIAPRDAIPLAETLRWIDDDPCFACLPSDFVAAPPATPPRKTDLRVSARRSVIHADAERFHQHRLLGSRSPPRV